MSTVGLVEGDCLTSGWEKNRRPPFDAQLGLEDVIECAILKVDPERMRVELSRRDDDVFFPSDSPTLTTRPLRTL